MYITIIVLHTEYWNYHHNTNYHHNANYTTHTVQLYEHSHLVSEESQSWLHSRHLQQEKTGTGSSVQKNILDTHTLEVDPPSHSILLVTFPLARSFLISMTTAICSTDTTKSMCLVSCDDVIIHSSVELLNNMTPTMATSQTDIALYM